MHHIHIHAPPRTYVRIHAPHTHTCTTYTYMHHQIPPENKICLVDLTSVLYERPNQNERFLLNNMFFSAFQWNAQCFSVKCAVSLKCAVHFSEMCTEMHKLTEMHNSLKCALCFSLKCAALFTEIANSMKSAVHFTEMHAFQQYFMSFWVPTKYRSFWYHCGIPIISFSVKTTCDHHIAVLAVSNLYQ